MDQWRDLLQFAVRLTGQLSDFPVSSSHLVPTPFLSHISQEVSRYSQRVPMVVLHLRIHQITEVLFSGVEAELYSSDEMPFIHWYTSLALSRQVETIRLIQESLPPNPPDEGEPRSIVTS